MINKLIGKLALLSWCWSILFKV